METPSKGVGNSSTRLSLEYKPVENLTPNPNNPRIHSDRQIRQIARSIEAFGFVFPVAISPSGQVVERTGRICYGIEIDPDFVDTIIRRLSAKHASSGRSFREREEEVGSELKH